MRLRSLALALTVCGVAAPGSVEAIPAFARRYKVDCVFCHAGFPKLNTMGQRFKEAGFRLEREDPFEIGQWLASKPVVLRGSANRFFLQERQGATSGFGKAISAGNLGDRLSYWVDDGLSISTDTVHTKPDNAWLRFDVMRDGRLYARAGRIELDLPFTHVRTPHLFSYEVYFANAGLETDSIAMHKDGVEVGGRLPADARWSLALVKGHGDATTGGFNPAVFVRLSKRLDGNRVGGFGYFGTSTLQLGPSSNWSDHVLRIGADADVWIGHWNVYGLYLHGRNDNSLGPPVQQGAKTSLGFDGGFAQVDYYVRSWLAVTFRGNMVNEPIGASVGSKTLFSSLLPGAQIFIFEHGRLSFEYGFQNRDRPRFGAIQAEFAF